MSKPLKSAKALKDINKGDFESLRKERRKELKLHRAEERFNHANHGRILEIIEESLYTNDVSIIYNLFEYMKDSPSYKKAFKEVVLESFDGVKINNPIDKDKNTLLHSAALVNDKEIVVFLLERGADANIKNKDHYIALSLNLMSQDFEKNEDLECARRLLAQTDFDLFGQHILEVCRKEILDAGDGTVSAILEDCFYKTDLVRVCEKKKRAIPGLQSEVEQGLLDAFDSVTVRRDVDDEIPQAEVSGSEVIQVDQKTNEWSQSNF